MIHIIIIIIIIFVIIILIIIIVIIIIIPRWQRLSFWGGESINCSEDVEVSRQRLRCFIIIDIIAIVFVIIVIIVIIVITEVWQYHPHRHNDDQASNRPTTFIIKDMQSQVGKMMSEEKLRM